MDSGIPESILILTWVTTHYVGGKNMEKMSIQKLAETAKDLVSNLTIRIDNIIYEYEARGEEGEFFNERVIFLLDDLSALVDAIDIIEKENININLEELTEKLKLLYNCLKEKDRMMFRDIMEFELKPLLEYWRDILDFTVMH